jgi:hypothetical protein
MAHLAALAQPRDVLFTRSRNRRPARVPNSTGGFARFAWLAAGAEGGERVRAHLHARWRCRSAMESGLRLVADALGFAPAYAAVPRAPGCGLRGQGTASSRSRRCAPTDYVNTRGRELYERRHSRGGDRLHFLRPYAGRFTHLLPGCSRSRPPRSLGRARDAQRSRVVSTTRDRIETGPAGRRQCARAARVLPHPGLLHAIDA